MKKYFALILAVLMVLALFPFGALAEEDEPIEDDPIEDEPIEDEPDDGEFYIPEGAEIIELVEIEGFVEPELGEPLSTDLTVPEDAHYYIDSCGWIRCDEEECEVLDEGTLADDEESIYFMFIDVCPDEGYAFTEDLIALMNGQKEYFEVIGVPSWDLAELMTYDYYFGEEPSNGEGAEEVNVYGFVEPEYGEAPCYDLTVPEDAPYRIVSVEWYRCGEDGEEVPMGDGELFDDPSSTYFMRILLEPTEDGVGIASWADAYIDDSDQYVCCSGFENGYYEIGTFEFEVTDPDAPVDEDGIEEVYLYGFIVPEYGEAPCYDITVPEDAPYRVVTVEWYRYDEDWEPVLMEEGEVFDDTETYYYMRAVLETTDPDAVFADYVDAYMDAGDDYDPVWYAEPDGTTLEVVTDDFDVFDPDDPYDPDDPDDPGEIEEPIAPPGSEEDEPIEPYPVPGGINYADSAKEYAAPPATGGMSFALLGLLAIAAGVSAKRKDD